MNLWVTKVDRASAGSGEPSAVVPCGPRLGLDGAFALRFAGGDDAAGEFGAGLAFDVRFREARAGDLRGLLRGDRLGHRGQATFVGGELLAFGFLLREARAVDAVSLFLRRQRGAGTGGGRYVFDFVFRPD